MVEKVIRISSKRLWCNCFSFLKFDQWSDYIDRLVPRVFSCCWPISTRNLEGLSQNVRQLWGNFSSFRQLLQFLESFCLKLTKVAWNMKSCLKLRRVKITFLSICISGPNSSWRGHCHYADFVKSLALIFPITLDAHDVNMQVEN